MNRLLKDVLAVLQSLAPFFVLLHSVAEWLPFSGYSAFILIVGFLIWGYVQAKHVYFVFLAIYYLTVPLGVLSEMPLRTYALTALMLFVKVGLGMSVCLHRYAAHAAFKTTEIFSFVLCFIGCFALQNGPIWWASKHRCHHRYCDTEGDPHSPHISGIIGAFVWPANPEHTYALEDFVPEHLNNIQTRCLEEIAPFIVLAEFLVSYRIFGASGLFVSYVSGIFCQAGTLWFNVINHMEDPREASKTICKSTDWKGVGGTICWDLPFTVPLHGLAFVFSFIVGEDQHSHHHTHPKASRRPGMDLPYLLFIRPLELLKLVK